jgi:hypothetical protein
MPLLNFFEGLDSVHARQADVQQHQVRRVLFHGFNGRLRLGKRLDPVRLFQRHGDAVPDQRFIVDHMYAVFDHPWAPASGIGRSMTNCAPPSMPQGVMCSLPPWSVTIRWLILRPIPVLPPLVV